MQGNFELERQYPIVRGNSLYTIVDGPSWTQAEANAVKLGGHLVTINNIEEYKWAADSFWTADNLNGMAFIGLNDAQQEGNYEWASGQQTEWNDLTDLICAQNWFDQQQHFGDWDYGIIGAGSTWEEIGLDDRFVPYQDRGTVILMDNSASFYANHGTSILGAAEIPFIRRGDSAYVIVEGPTWEEAEANANALGGHLVTINDADENEWLSTRVRDEIIQKYSLEFGYGSESYTAEEWRYNPLIGYSDVMSEGNWIWADNSSSEYTNWYPGEPNSSTPDSNYAVMYLFGYNSVDPSGNSTLGKWDDTSGGTIGIAEIPPSAQQHPNRYSKPHRRLQSRTDDQH